MGLFSAVVGVVKDIAKRKPKRPARPAERKQAPRPVQPKSTPRPAPKPVRTEKPKPKPPQKVTPTPKPKPAPKPVQKQTRKKNRRRARILRSKQKELARLKKEKAIAEQLRRKKLQEVRKKRIKKEPIVEPIDWGLTPEEEMLASMTVDEVKEYLKNADIDKLNTNVDFFADAVINNYRSEINQYPSHAEPIITKWLNSLIDEWGKQAVAEMLQKGAEAGVILTRKIAYDDDLLEGYLSDMINYMPEMSDGMREMIMDSFDSWSDIN